MNSYVHFRFFQKLSIPPLYRHFGTALLGFLFICQLLYALSFRYEQFPTIVFLILGTAIGFSFMLFVVALGYDIVQSVAKLVLKSNGQLNGHVRIGVDALALLLVATYLISGLIGGFRPPNWVNVKVPIQIANHDTFRIVQLSDVHVGHVIKRPFVENLVKRINQSSADIVVITGDLIDRNPDRIIDDLAPLANIQSRYGVYFAAGNHEYFHNPKRGLEIVRSLGIHVLDDESVIVKEKDGTPLFTIVGLRDLVGRSRDIPGFVPDVDKAFESIDHNLPVIVLAHQPAWLSEIGRFKPDLVLTGHTHGGQIFPFSYLVYLNQPFLNGLHTFNDNDEKPGFIYVSRGTGFWGPPIRVLAPSEITELILTAD